MTTEELESLARAQPNPFAGSVVRNGFEAPQNDVPEIHGEQRSRLRALVEEVRRTGELLLQVVTGEPGDGKTHLLATLRAEAERSWHTPGAAWAMVPIEPLRDPDAPFLHILQGLVRGLRRPFADAAPQLDPLSSPFEHILWRILQRAVQDSPHPACVESAELLLRLPYPSAAAVLLRERWALLEPVLRDAAPAQADADVWAVLCRFPSQPQPAMRWLGGSSLPEEELRPLGAVRPIDDEDRAFKTLSTLLQLTDVPIALGFDQLEGVTRLGDGAVENFLQALGDQLYTSGGRAALLLFCQADAWKGFEARLQRQVQDRFTQRAYLHLARIEPALGEKLIECRLAAMWRGLGIAPPHPTFPYPKGWVLQSIIAEPLVGPRRILSWFAARGFDVAHAAAPPAPRAPAEVALAEYERLRRETPGDRTPDEAAAVAQSVLVTVLEKAPAIGEVKVIAARRGKHGLEVKLARGGKELSAYAEASNSRHGMAAKAVAKRFKDALKKSDRAVWLRDERIPLPPLATGMLAELGDKAAVVRVDAESTRGFSAIEKLLNGAAARDIEVPLEVAIGVVVETIAPRLSAVRQFLDAATLSTKVSASPVAALAPEALVLAAISKPPYVVSELQLAKLHGVALEEVVRGSDALVRAGKAEVRLGKDGGRVVMRRSR